LGGPRFCRRPAVVGGAVQAGKTTGRAEARPSRRRPPPRRTLRMGNLPPPRRCERPTWPPKRSGGGRERGNLVVWHRVKTEIASLTFAMTTGDVRNHNAGLRNNARERRGEPVCSPVTEGQTRGSARTFAGEGIAEGAPWRMLSRHSREGDLPKTSTNTNLICQVW